MSTDPAFVSFGPRVQRPVPAPVAEIETTPTHDDDVAERDIQRPKNLGGGNPVVLQSFGPIKALTAGNPTSSADAHAKQGAAAMTTPPPHPPPAVDGAFVF